LVKVLEYNLAGNQLRLKVFVLINITILFV